MSVTRISYSAGSIGGTNVAQAVSHVLAAQAAILRAKSMATSVGGGALLEGTEFSAVAGKGIALETAITNLNSNLALITAAVLADLDMGG